MPYRRKEGSPSKGVDTLSDFPYVTEGKKNPHHSFRLPIA